MSHQQKHEVLLDKEGFICIICQGTPKELFTLPCEHSFCSSCVEGPQDQGEEGRQVYSCPHCKKAYSPKPCLKRKHVLPEVVEELMKTGDQQASPSASASKDVICDFCTWPSCNKAITSCLACLVSLCETHQQSHYNIPELRTHKLIKATTPLQNKMCPGHNRLLEVFCRTDQQCICYQCAMDEHKDHNTLSTKAERDEKQKQLDEIQKGVYQRIQETEKKMEELTQAVESSKSSAQAALEASESIFTELAQSIESRRREVEELIRTREASVISQAEGVLKTLEKEMAELRRADAELKGLYQIDDHIGFIQSFQSLPSPSTPLDLSSITVPSPINLTEVSDRISDVRDKVEEILKETWPTTTSARVGVLAPVEHRTREYFLQYACPLSVDLNTINNRLSLSEENRKVTVTNKCHPYPEHAERFTFWWETLFSEGQSARSYWEVEWSGAGVCIAIAYKDIRRTGFVDQSRFGYNDKSWSLECFTEGYRFKHNNVPTEVTGPQSSKIGVYLDPSAGTLSYYSVSDTMTHLHTVQTKFHQVLYPGLWIYGVNSTAEVCQIW